MYPEVKIQGSIVNVFENKITIENRLSQRISTATMDIELKDFWRTPLVHSYTSPFNLREIYMPQIEEIIPRYIVDVDIIGGDYLSKLFGGYVAMVDLRKIGLTKVYHIQCQDYNSRLGSILVDETYSDNTAGEVITDLFTKYWSEIDTSEFVEGTPDYPYPHLYENYITGDDWYGALAGVNWKAQTFTPAHNHKITKVKLKLYAYAAFPLVLTVSIRAVDGTGHPTGGDLSIGTRTGALTEDAGGAWYEIPLTDYDLVAGTKYAIVVREVYPTVYVLWKADITGGTYAGGNGETSGDSGVNWASEAAGWDYMFEEWGVGKALSIVFSDIYLLEALEQLASIFGMQFYIDYDKKLHFFAPTTTGAPFPLGDQLLDATLDVDVGSEAIDRASFLSYFYTAIDLANPANFNGNLTSIEVWANNNITGFRVGTFYLVSGTTYKCRDSTPAIEDFTTYTEVDPNGKLTVTAPKATAVDADGDEDVYLYKDKGVNYFDSLHIDFEIFIDSATLNQGTGGIALANLIGTIIAFGTTEVVVIGRRVGAAAIISLARGYYVDSVSYTASFDTLYYCTLERATGNDTINLKIYSDIGRTTLLNTLTISGFSTTKWRYVYGFINHNTGSSGIDFDGYIQNMGIGESVIGNIVAGSKQTFPVSLAIQRGDFIGWTASSGQIERDTVGGSGVMAVAGHYIDVGDEVNYTLLSDFAISLKGEGISTKEPYQIKEWKSDAACLINRVTVKGTGVEVTRQDDASYAKYGAWFDSLHVDLDIDTTAWAELVGDAILLEAAFEKVVGRLILWQEGLVAGQKVRIINVLYGIDDYYLIQAMQMRMLGGGQEEIEIEVGDYRRDLVELLAVIDRLERRE